MDISGDADNFMSNAERLIGYRSHKKQNEQIDEGGAAGAPSLNFDSLNNAMDAIAQTIDPNSKTMRVSIEKDNTSSTLGSFFGHDAFKEGIERNNINTETRSNK
jgi:peptide methionine sulfoxide reductase MsrB